MDADDAGILDPEGRRVGTQIRLVEDDELWPLVEIGDEELEWE